MQLRVNFLTNELLLLLNYMKSCGVCDFWALALSSSAIKTHCPIALIL